MFAPLFVYSYLTAALSTRETHRNERGASFTEYVVLLAGIVALVVAGIITITTYVNGKLVLP